MRIRSNRPRRLIKFCWKSQRQSPHIATWEIYSTISAARLHGVVQFDYLNLILHDAKRNVMRLHTLEANRPTIIQPGLETPVEWSAAGYVLETQQPLVVPDVMQDERFPRMREILSQENIVSYCILPLTTAQHRLGCLGFGHSERHEYTSAEVEFMRQVARQVLVDELAHTNVEGSRHPKRYMDVEEILAAGIDVYSTLNVQHLENPNDVVAKITRVRVSETVPDPCWTAPTTSNWSTSHLTT